MKTQDEIMERIKALKDDDFFGFGREVLIGALSFENAKKLDFVAEGATKELWDKDLLGTDEAVKKAALGYLSFAWGKAEDHRGISASRSVDKMTSYLWLLGKDDAVKAIGEASFAQYGCPKLKIAAEALGSPLPTSQSLVNMMNGESCCSDCEEGCGQ